jgi:hypothetical protein
MNKKATLALFISVAGLVSHPEILGLLSEKWAGYFSLLGIILQALTKAINEAEA